MAKDKSIAEQRLDEVVAGRRAASGQTMGSVPGLDPDMSVSHDVIMERFQPRNKYSGESNQIRESDITGLPSYGELLAAISNSFERIKRIASEYGATLSPKLKVENEAPAFDKPEGQIGEGHPVGQYNPEDESVNLYMTNQYDWRGDSYSMNELSDPRWEALQNRQKWR